MALRLVGHTIRWTLSFFRVALNDSAQALSQRTPVLPVEAMISYLLRCWESCSEVYWHPRSEWNTVSPCRVRAPAGRHIDRLAHQGPVPRVVAPIAYPTAFLVQQPGDGRQADRPPPRVRIQMDVAHPPALSACWRREPAPGPGRGARLRARRPEAVAPGPFGVAAAWRALLTHGQVRTASGGCLNAPAGPGGVSTTVPAGWRGSC